MRITVVHSYYASGQPSGENHLVDAEVAALQAAGHDVALVAVRTDDLVAQASYRACAALTVATGRGRSPSQAIRTSRPDVVHIHNLFPNFGRSWVAHLDVPFVHTLHNYRPVCAAGTLHLNAAHGRHPAGACTLCLDKTSLHAIANRCYRGSVLASVPLAIASSRVRRDPVLARAAQLLTLTSDMRDIYVRAGVREAQLTTVPNFVPAALDQGPGEGSQRWLYVGRLAPEKGIVRLLHDWPAALPLTVVGAGPQLAEATSAATGKNVELVPQTDRAHVLALMRSSLGLLLPSRWLEGFPLVYAEALASGLPVLAWPQNGVARLVATDGTGVVADDDLRRSLERAAAAFPRLRTRCREAFEERYTEQAHVQQLEEVYAAALARH